MKTLEISQDVHEIITKHGTKREALLPILQELVERKRYLTEDLIKEVSKAMSLSPNEVFSVATFYSFINTKPKGKFIIRICNTIGCDLAGKDEIVKSIEKELRIREGETTFDQKFTLEYTNCIGMCDQGPAMLINDEVYTKLDTKKAVEIVREYKKR